MDSVTETQAGTGSALQTTPERDLNLEIRGIDPLLFDPSSIANKYNWFGQEGFVPLSQNMQSLVFDDLRLQELQEVRSSRQDLTLGQQELLGEYQRRISLRTTETESRVREKQPRIGEPTPDEDIRNAHDLATKIWGQHQQEVAQQKIATASNPPKSV